MVHVISSLSNLSYSNHEADALSWKFQLTVKAWKQAVRDWANLQLAHGSPEWTRQNTSHHFWFFIVHRPEFCSKKKYGLKINLQARNSYRMSSYTQL